MALACGCAGQGAEHSVTVSITQLCQTCKAHIGHSAELVQGIGCACILGIGDSAGLAQHLIEIAAIGIGGRISGAVRHGGGSVAVVGIGGRRCNLLAGFAAEGTGQHITHAVMGQSLGGDTVGRRHHTMDEGGIVGIGGSNLIRASAAGLLHNGFHIAVAVISDRLLIQACGGRAGGIAIIIIGVDINFLFHHGQIVEIRDIGIRLIDTGDGNGRNCFYCAGRDYRQAGVLPPGHIGIEGHIAIVLGSVRIDDGSPNAKLLGMVISRGGTDGDIIRHRFSLGPAGYHITLDTDLIDIHRLRSNRV